MKTLATVEPSKLVARSLGPAKGAKAIMIGPCLFFLSLFAYNGAVQAETEELPLWEIAVGGGVVQVPVYRGSESTKTFPFPFIFPVYRGEFLRLDDTGIRGILLKSDRLELDFSLDGNVKVDSDETEARLGMPDLDATVQFGPALTYNLWQTPNYDDLLVLNIPIRAVFSVSSSNIDNVGYTSSPHVTYYRKKDRWGRRWVLGLTAGLEFGSEEFHNYYYEVAPEFATPARPAYQADGGFGGYRFIATLTSRGKRSWASIFARYDLISGAEFDDSPLIDRNDGLTVGVAAVWFLFQSKKTVKRDRYH